MWSIAFNMEPRAYGLRVSPMRSSATTLGKPYLARTPPAKSASSTRILTSRSVRKIASPAGTGYVEYSP